MQRSGSTCFGNLMLKVLRPNCWQALAGCKGPCVASCQTRGKQRHGKIAVNAKWKVTTIAYPMIMGFDGMAHFLHPRLMKFQRNLQLRGLMNHAGHLTIKKVVKNVVKGGVKIHSHGYTSW